MKEIFYTLQGEGHNAGRPAVFVRFGGCNLWSGREEDRAEAICNFCDTDFIGGQNMAAINIARRAVDLWPDNNVRRFCVLTGGEPSLQVDDELLGYLEDAAFEIAIETNGTRPAPAVDWITVSPKPNAKLVQQCGDEIKVIYGSVSPTDYDDLAFRYWYIQPMDGADNMAHAARYCMEHPKWRLSLQMHKTVGLR